eukprot:08678.XXX_234402_234770_1 [CDS] Oithona nana genome sequencing.
MSKALMIVLAFWALAYECEGVLFFHHVPKSEEPKGVPIPNKDALWEEMSVLLKKLLTTEDSRLEFDATFNKKPICRMNDVTRRFSCMPIIPINIRRLQRLQLLE